MNRKEIWAESPIGQSVFGTSARDTALKDILPDWTFVENHLVEYENQKLYQFKETMMERIVRGVELFSLPVMLEC